MHCAERWIWYLKWNINYIVFFFNFFKCKKNTITRGTHAKIFNFVLTPVPDSHFSRLFSSPPPPLIRKRGEKISERTLDQSWDDILVNTFGDCPTTIWQTVIGWWWWYWCHCTASQCHDDGDGDDDGDDGDDDDVHSTALHWKCTVCQRLVKMNCFGK